VPTSSYGDPESVIQTDEEDPYKPERYDVDENDKLYPGLHSVQDFIQSD